MRTEPTQAITGAPIPGRNRSSISVCTSWTTTFGHARPKHRVVMATAANWSLGDRIAVLVANPFTRETGRRQQKTLEVAPAAAAISAPIAAIAATITTASAAASSAISTAAAMAAPEASALWTSLVHGQCTAFHLLPVEDADGPLYVFTVGKFDKSKPTGIAGHLVTDHDCGRHREPRVGDKIRKGAVGSTVGKVSDVEF